MNKQTNRKGMKNTSTKLQKNPSLKFHNYGI